MRARAGPSGGTRGVSAAQLDSSGWGHVRICHKESILYHSVHRRSLKSCGSPAPSSVHRRPLWQIWTSLEVRTGPGTGVCRRGCTRECAPESVGDVLAGGVVVPAAVSVVDGELEVGAHGQGVDADQGGLDVGDGVEAGHDEVAGRVVEVVGVGQDPPSVVDGVDGLLPAGPLDVAPTVDDVAGDQAAPGVLR